MKVTLFLWSQRVSQRLTNCAMFAVCNMWWQRMKTSRSAAPGLVWFFFFFFASPSHCSPLGCSSWHLCHQCSCPGLSSMKVHTQPVCAAAAGGGALRILIRPNTPSHDTHCGILRINYQPRQMGKRGIPSMRKGFFFFPYNSLRAHQDEELALMCPLLWVRTRRKPSPPVNLCLWLGESEGRSGIGRIWTDWG